jgi:hypothetical protein
VNVLLGLCLVASARCLWIRRATWPSHWDGSATNSIVLLTVNVLLQTPQIGDPISPYLHALTGVWNLEDLIGHICYIGALMGFLAMGAMRLQLTDRQRQKFLRTHIQLVGCISVPVAVALFVWAKGEGHYAGDLVLQGGGPRATPLAPYWIFMVSVIVYLSVINIIVFLELARNPVSRLTSRLYLAGFCLTLSNCALAALNGVTHLGGVPLWVSVHVEMLTFCVAAGVSWTRRRRAKGRGPDITPAPAVA